MAGSTKDAWNEVGEHFSEFGRKVADRYKELGGDASPQAEEDRRRLEDAVKGVTEQLDRAFTSVGDALRDPGTKATMSEAVRSLGEALATTVEVAGEGIRKRFGSDKTGEDGDATA